MSTIIGLQQGVLWNDVCENKWNELGSKIAAFFNSNNDKSVRKSRLSLAITSELVPVDDQIKENSSRYDVGI